MSSQPEAKKPSQPSKKMEDQAHHRAEKSTNRRTNEATQKSIRDTSRHISKKPPRDFKHFIDQPTLPTFTPERVATNAPINVLSPQTSMIKLLKLKIPEFAGDPLHWPEGSSLFLPTFDSAPIADSLKMNHLKTLVRGKAKSVIAVMGYSGERYLSAWNALVRNFGRPQLVVNAQLKQLHTFPFIKPYDSAAIIKFAQLVSSCVNVLHQFDCQGDLQSESVLNSAVRKLPPELKTKWLFYSKAQQLGQADFVVFAT